MSTWDENKIERFALAKIPDKLLRLRIDKMITNSYVRIEKFRKKREAKRTHVIDGTILHQTPWRFRKILSRVVRNGKGALMLKTEYLIINKPTDS